MSAGELNVAADDQSLRGRVSGRESGRVGFVSCKALRLAATALDRSRSIARCSGGVLPGETAGYFSTLPVPQIHRADGAGKVEGQDRIESLEALYVTRTQGVDASRIGSANAQRRNDQLSPVAAAEYRLEPRKSRIS